MARSDVVLEFLRLEILDLSAPLAGLHAEGQLTTVMQLSYAQTEQPTISVPAIPGILQFRPDFVRTTNSPLSMPNLVLRCYAREQLNLFHPQIPKLGNVVPCTNAFRMLFRLLRFLCPLLYLFRLSFRSKLQRLLFRSNQLLCLLLMLHLTPILAGCPIVRLPPSSVLPILAPTE